MAAYRIFEPHKSSFSTKDILVFGVCFLSLVAIGLSFLLKASYFIIIFSLTMGLACSALLLLLYFLNERSIDFKKGRFTGYLEFLSDAIIIQTTKIPLDDIASLSIVNDDFRYKYQSNKIWGPKLSIGTHNQLILCLKNQRPQHLFFLQEHDNELVKSALALACYHRAGILTEENLNIIVGTDKK